MLLKVLEKTSEEFTRIVDYVKNTHAATHQQYELQVLDVSTACCAHCMPVAFVIRMIYFI